MEDTGHSPRGVTIVSDEGFVASDGAFFESEQPPSGRSAEIASKSATQHFKYFFIDTTLLSKIKEGAHGM